MDLDLNALTALHPKMHMDIASPLAMHAGLSLQSGGHAPGVMLDAHIDAGREALALCWVLVDEGLREQTDRKRNTEDGAEAVALALAHERKRWTFSRRLQQGEHADYLLSVAENPSARRRLVALEVSGSATIDTARLREKLAQVGKCWLEELQREPDIKAACVVDFGPPRARLATTPGSGIAP